MSEEKDRRDLKGYHPEDEEPMPSRGHKKKPGRRYKGCPATDNHGAHVYVWIEMRGRAKVWKFGDGDGWKWVDKVWYDRECVGCGKIKERDFGWFRRKPSQQDIYEVRHDQEYKWNY